MTGGDPTQKPTLAIVAPWVYHPNCGIGGGVLCFRALEMLSTSHDIHFLSFDETPNDLEGGKRALAALCLSVTVVPLVHPGTGHMGFAARWRRRLSGWLRLLLEGVPREVQMGHSDAMSSALRRLVERTRPDAVIFQFPQMAHYIADAAGVPTLMDVQDANLVSRYRRWQATPRGVRRWVNALGWWAWARYELRWYGRATALLALSETDQGVLRAYVPGVPCHLAPVATDVRHALREPVGRVIGFVGNFHHAPNRDGFEWMLEEVWPRVRERVPDAVLWVAGPGSPTPSGILQAQGVLALGFVDDIDRFFASLSVAIVPYRFGGGVKIKALEAMARACPVVATTIGEEGLGCTHGEQLLVADGASEFAASIVQLLLAPSDAEAMGRRAQAHIEANFSWRAKTDGMVRLLAGLRQERQP